MVGRGRARQGPRRGKGNKTTNKGKKKMDQYYIELIGLTPLLMHNDNLTFSEKLTQWRKDPANKDNTLPGDDRTPPWTWIEYLYHDGDIIGIPSDNLMTMLREGGSKVTKKGKETFKKQTQSGIMIDQQQFALTIDGKAVSVESIRPLIGDTEFNNHINTAEGLGFELLVKRAKIGRAKHVRVRPMFRNWKLSGSLTVLDPELSGINQTILETILNQSGALCGLCDWRPSSPSSGTFGKFKPTIKKL